MRALRFATVLAGLIACGSAGAACPPDGMTRAHMSELRGAKWDVPDDARRERIAIGMLDCLQDPDPGIRDEIAFEALQSWMRAGKLGTPTVHTIRSTLLARMRTLDAIGFAQPFAALVLAEVARIDRIKPFLSAAERSELARAASAYLAGLRDYRGFDAKEGWRHGVAHTADLMMQLALNPALEKADQLAMLDAIAAQVQAPGPTVFPHFYQYGEGERLVAPVFYLARRDTVTLPEWEAFFARMKAKDSRATQAGLAQRHNLKGFLYPLHVNLSESTDAAQRARLLPIVTRTLKQVD